MSSWQRVRFPPFFDAKPSRPSRSSQIGESLIWNAGSSSHKLQQSQSLFVCKLFNHMPEPNYHLMSICRIKLIIRIGFLGNFQKLPWYPERYSVFCRQSLMSISAVPAITSSNSRASKTETSLGSTTS